MTQHRPWFASYPDDVPKTLEPYPEKNLFRLGQLSILPELLGERKKEPALRIRFDPELQLFDFCGYPRRSHLLKIRILLNNRRRRNLGRRKEPPPVKGAVRYWKQSRRNY